MSLSITVRWALWTLCALGVGNLCHAQVTVVDDIGARVVVPRHPDRIVSLSPGATETLFAAGAGPKILATVEFSDEPPAARPIPRIGDVVSIDLERLVALHPQVVVAWPGGTQAGQLEKILRLGFPVYRQEVRRLADIPASIRRLGALAGTEAVADSAATDLERRLATLDRDSMTGSHPTVLLQVWDRPIYTVGAGRLLSDVLRACGARNAFGDLTDAAPTIDVEAAVARDPDIIVAAAPYGVSAQWLAEWQRFPQLRAVRNHRLIGFEDPRLTRLGPGIVAATEALCRRLAAADPGS